MDLGPNEAPETLFRERVIDLGSFWGSFWGRKEVPKSYKNELRSRTKFRSDFEWFRSGPGSALGCQNVDFVLVFQRFFASRKFRQSIVLGSSGVANWLQKGAKIGPGSDQNQV